MIRYGGGWTGSGFDGDLFFIPASEGLSGGISRGPPARPVSGGRAGDPAPDHAVSLNAGYTYREILDASGESVLDHLTRTRRHSSWDTWMARIEAGEVLLDGVKAHLHTLLRAGQVLQWNRPGWDEPVVDAPMTWIHVDEAILAVGKPRGLPTLPAGGMLQQTLLARVRKEYPEARPMHRLGRETSGLVLFARTREAAAILQAAWREHRVQKVYRALAAGIPPWDAMEIRTPIGPVSHSRLGTVHAATPAGKPTLSLARVLELRPVGTLLEVEILTGRPHQIRIHLASAGHPLVGDPLYGPGGMPLEDPGLPGDGGYFLHAGRLAFAHPLTGAWTRLRAEAPEELRLANEG